MDNEQYYMKLKELAKIRNQRQDDLESILLIVNIPKGVV